MFPESPASAIGKIHRIGYTVDPATSCWLWRGAINGKGYAQMHFAGGTCNVSRIIGWLSFGLRDEAMQMCHRCDNPRCVNPAHLFVGSRTDNMRDMVQKKRHWSTRKTHCKNGHPFDEENTILLETQRRCRICKLTQSRASDTRKRRAVGIAPRKFKQPKI